MAQGEVIGYVGATGAATGPHLHYEYRVRGVHKNPAKVVMPRAELPPSYLAEFRAQADVAARADEPGCTARERPGLRREHPLSGPPTATCVEARESRRRHKAVVF